MHKSRQLTLDKFFMEGTGQCTVRNMYVECLNDLAARHAITLTSLPLDYQGDLGIIRDCCINGQQTIHGVKKIKMYRLLKQLTD